MSKRFITWTWTVCLVFFAQHVLYAQEVLDLKKCFTLLKQQNIQVKQAQVNLLLAKQETKDAKNSFIPSVSLGMGHNYNLGLAFDQIAGQLVTGNKWSNTANANLNMNTVLFQGFNRSNAVKLAILAEESKKNDINKLEKTLKLELVGLYYDILVNFSLYEASLAQLAHSKTQLEQEQTQFDIGTKTMVDLSLAESLVAHSELNVLSMKNAYDNQLLSLKQLLNINFQDSISLYPVENENIIQLDNPILTYQEPNIYGATLSIRQAELQLKNAKSTYYPTIRFNSGYGTNYSSERKDFITGQYMPFGDQFNQNKSLYLGLSLSFPILDGFKTRSTIHKSKLHITLQQNELDRVSKEQEKILIMAQQEYRKAIKELQVFNIQSNSLKKSFNAIQERYDLGVSSSLDYAKAQLDYNTSVFNLIKAKYLVNYHVDVLKVLNQE